MSDGKLSQRLVNSIKISEPFVNGFYRAKIGDEFIAAGELVYACHDGNVVEFICLDKEYRYDLDEFLERYEFIPDGEEQRKLQMEALSNEIRSIGEQELALNKQALNLSPHINDHGDLIASADGGSAGLTVVVTTPLEVKKTIANFRNDIARLKQEVITKSKRLQLLIKEQQTIMQIKLNELTAGIKEKVDELQVMVEQAEEVIWTINLYLGKDEEIIPLRRGKAAPANVPIVVRQLVLFMDEECAASDLYGMAECGGVDATSIDQFDAWLIADQSHLEQVLPEEKGLVAIKPRRYHRNYGDPWLDNQMAKANKATYFLIRNGENVYRILVDFDIGYTLIPSQHEFLDAFYEEDYDWRINKRVRTPIRPGSQKYMEVMKMLDDKRKHYFKVALILQGLLDRTKILHPLPLQRLNVLDPNCYEGPDGITYLSFIYDAESSQMLPDGRPSYDDWFTEANKNLCVGQRIIGFFNFSHGDRYGGKDTRQERILPASASPPDSLELYTIDSIGDKPGSFYFYYKRKDYIYRRHDDSGEAKVRARCTVYHNDNFIINFDAPNVTIDALEYYIRSRRDRHRYLDMMPVLKRALIMKKKEQTEEEPFLKLIIGQIMMKYGVDHASAAEAVPELVQWWKFKNQKHRALLSNDKAALKMIIQEYDIRRRRKLESLNDDGYINDLLTTIKSTNSNKTVILVAHKRANEYVALIAHNDENVFVTEQSWSINKSSNCPAGQRIKLKESKEWRTVDGRWKRWRIIIADDRWNNWIKDSRNRGYLPDPERQRAVDIIVNLVSDHMKKLWKKRDKIYYEPEDLKNELIPLAISLQRNDSSVDYFLFYYCDRQAILPQEALISNQPHGPSIAVVQIEWKKSAAGHYEFSVRSDRYGSHVTMSLENPSWRSDYHGNQYRVGRAGFVKLMKEWPDNIQSVLGQEKFYLAYKKRADELSRLVDEAVCSINKQLDEREAKREYDRYISEFGDPEMWEEHKKTIRIARIRYANLDDHFRVLIEHGIDCNRLTLAEVYERSQPYLDAEAAEHAELDKKRGYKKWRGYRPLQDGCLNELRDEDKDLKAIHGPIPCGPINTDHDSELQEFANAK